MQVRAETVAEMKTIKFGRFDTIFCVETEKEYYLEPNGAGLTPDDDDYIQAAHGANYRYVAMEARGAGGGSAYFPDDSASITDALDTGVADDVVITLTNNAGGVTINGMGGGVPGKRVTLINRSAGNLSVNHEAAADPANDIAVPGNGQVDVATGHAVQFIYSPSGKWETIGSTQLMFG